MRLRDRLGPAALALTLAACGAVGFATGEFWIPPRAKHGTGGPDGYALSALAVGLGLTGVILSFTTQDEPKQGRRRQADSAGGEEDLPQRSRRKARGKRDR